MPIISIIVPVYNVEKYIGRCIESVQNQTFTDWELILVDDCGSDSSMQLVKYSSQNDERIHFIESQTNSGPMLAREKGVQYSKGDYLLFLDGDDTLPNDALNLLLENIRLTNCDIISGEIVRVQPDGTHSFFKHQDHVGVFSRKEIFKKMITGVYPHNLAAKLFKADLLRNREYYLLDGMKNGEDGFLFYQVLSNTKNVSIINDIVYEYWTYSSSSSHKKLNEKIISDMSKFSLFQKTIFEREIGEGYFEDYNRLLVLSIVNLSKKYSYIKIRNIFHSQGLLVDLSPITLLKLFPLKQALLTFLVTRFYSPLRFMFLK